MAIALKLLLRGQTNFVRGMWLYGRTYNLKKMVGDHAQRVDYHIPLPPERVEPREVKAQARRLYIHAPRGRKDRGIDHSTEQFADATRMGAG